MYMDLSLSLYIYIYKRCVCVYVCIYIYIHTYVYREIHMYTYVYAMSPGPTSVAIRARRSRRYSYTQPACHILPPSEIGWGLFSYVFTGSEGKHLFHRIGWKGRIWQLHSMSRVAKLSPFGGGALKTCLPPKTYGETANGSLKQL